MQCLYFCTSRYFKAYEDKIPIDPDKIFEEIFALKNLLCILS